mmetsp:Transcript_18335/g.64410  ORF Transcript_18335/g.64410 Transcript_18335/m.64410 type:complete len:306 (+) Transcript_18335:67-984(+)
MASASELPREPPREAVRQSDGSYTLELEDGTSCRWTRRPDGSWRKPERKKAGWVGDLEQKKYVSPGQVQADRVREDLGRAPRSTIPGLPPGYMEELEAKKKTANDRKKEVRKEKSEAAEAARHADAPSLFKLPEREYAGTGEEDIAPALAPAAAPAAPNPKAVEKKLRQISDLEERRAKGEALNEDQLSKLQSKTELEEELARLRIGGEPASEASNPTPVAASAKLVAVAPSAVAASTNGKVAPAAPPVQESAESKGANKKAIDKKLRQIADLEERQAKGEVLNEDQLAKLAAKSELEAALKSAA